MPTCLVPGAEHLVPVTRSAREVCTRAQRVTVEVIPGGGMADLMLRGSRGGDSERWRFYVEGGRLVRYSPAGVALESYASLRAATEMFAFFLAGGSIDEVRQRAALTTP